MERRPGRQRAGHGATHRGPPAAVHGAFCPRTGEALASLFLKPISAAQLQGARTWADCAEVGSQDGAQPSRDLFGISLSSVSPQGVEAILRSSGRVR